MHNNMNNNFKNDVKSSVVMLCLALLLWLWPGQSPFANDVYGRSCTTDAQCDDGLFCNGTERCVNRECVLGSQVICDRGHVAGTPAYQIAHCDEDRDACVTPGEDHDGDGHDSIRAGGDDCDDNDPLAYPGNVEICDDRGHDEDCDPTTVGSKDTDGDGYTDSKCFNTLPDGSHHFDTRRH